MYMNTPHLQRGLSLVEVFVALLVLSVGLIALAKLQVDLVRGSSDARTRTIALSLAEEKVEDLRTFAQTNGAGTWSVTANPMAWSYVNGPAITTFPTPPDMSCSPACTGGRIPPQTTYSSALEVAGVRFKRTWEVAARDFTGTGPITSRTKDARVTVAWQNEMGVEQQVNVLANVVEIPPGNVALASEPVSERPTGPQVSYSPGLAPDIISIDIGGGKKRETTKPLPDVVGNSGTNVVRFDVVNYNSSNKVTRREEFISVNCGCNIDSAGPARTPAHWTYVGNLLRETPGVLVNKTRGSYSATGSNSDEVCVICCRDHHDYSSGGTDYRYNPADTGNHQHYKRQNNGTYTAATSVGDPYDEACRLKRVNGVFQVFEDWNLQTVTAIPQNDLNEGATTQTAYKDYVAALVRRYVDSSQATPTVPTFSTTTVAPGGASQLQGRTIYIDYMTTAQKTAAAARITPSDNQSVLEAVPWYEVNLTKIANWKLQQINSNTDYTTVSGQNCSASTSQSMLSTPSPLIACIANQAVVDESLLTPNQYFRGLVKAGPQSGSLDAQVYLRNGNTGVTGTNAITPASDTGTQIVSEHRFTNSTATGPQSSGVITRGSTIGNNTNPWPAVTCVYSILNGPTNVPCPLDPQGTANSDKTNPRSITSFDTPAGSSVTVTVTYSGGVVCPASVTRLAPASDFAFVLQATGTACP